MAIDEIVTDPNLSAVLGASRETRLHALALVDQLAAVGSLDAASPDIQSEASKRQKLLITNLAQLRGMHRAAQFGARQTKTQTSEARHEVDTLHLQLQNLYYEQRHLQGEIAACESYDHTYQQLPLIPVEEFLALQPEHENNDDENALMVARIEHERAEREALEQQRMELLKRKQKLIADNKKRKDDLANLDKELEKFIDAAKPIQNLFDKNVQPTA
ncbi:Fms-interacting protein-domain-containing protein [Microdochium bolleyi]|uniref:Fms-interacting protein-domain-containing protein n=1 Tax=Microdochium bolleyi TaxID=196109 RepID=A0A136JE76_9PEZI|nr:Fms-interacting protein-domain-containing protein [Microdochium bolleyi]